MRERSASGALVEEARLVAILIDATIVRGVLLPATMKLLGERNWYLPRWLEWLPRFEAGEPSRAVEAPSAPVSA